MPTSQVPPPHIKRSGFLLHLRKPKTPSKIFLVIPGEEEAQDSRAGKMGLKSPPGEKEGNLGVRRGVWVSSWPAGEFSGHPSLSSNQIPSSVLYDVHSIALTSSGEVWPGIN